MLRTATTGALESRLRRTAATTTGVQWKRCDRLRSRPKVVACVSIHTYVQPAASLEEKLGSRVTITAAHHASASLQAEQQPAM